MGSPGDTCRLCTKRVCIQRGHILPRWAYRALIALDDNRDPNPHQVADNLLLRSGRQDADYMLCPNCEQRFSDWEGPVRELVVPDREGHSRLRGLLGLRTIGATEESVLYMFAISVVFRAAVSNLYPKSKLGPFQETVRRGLLGDVTDVEAMRQACHVLVSVYDESAYARTVASRIIVGPERQSVGTHTEHRFIVPGAEFRVRVGGQVASEGLPPLVLQEVDPSTIRDMVRHRMQTTPRRSLVRRRG